MTGSNYEAFPGSSPSRSASGSCRANPAVDRQPVGSQVKSAGDLEPDSGRAGHSLVSVERNVLSGWLGTACLGAAALAVAVPIAP